MNNSKLINNKFGRLTVLSLDSKRTPNRGRRYLCLCDCGKKTIVASSNLTKGHTKSCGCYRLEIIKKSLITHGQSRRNREYKIWQSMIDRCTNVNCKAYKNYGGRGITVCDRWLNSFVNYISDMGKRTNPNHTLDRIDNNGHYEPGNCRWATRKEQSRNRRNNHWIEYNGIRMIFSDWAEYFGITLSSFSWKLKIKSFSEIMKLHIDRLHKTDNNYFSMNINCSV